PVGPRQRASRFRFPGSPSAGAERLARTPRTSICGPCPDELLAKVRLDLGGGRTRRPIIPFAWIAVPPTNIPHRGTPDGSTDAMPTTPTHTGAGAKLTHPHAAMDCRFGHRPI